MGYKKNAIIGIGWMGLLQGVLKLMAFVKIAILAKLLGQYEIGLFSIAILILGMLETFTEFGIGTFFIQKNSKIEKYIGSAYVLQICRGFVLSLVMLIVAIPVSIFFKSDQIAPLIYLSSLIPLIKSFENPYVVIFQKELLFGKEFMLRVTTTLADFVLIILFSFIFKNAVAVILGLIFSNIAYVGLSFVLISKKPRIAFEREKVGEILLFARSISALGVVTYLANQVDSFFIGRFLGVATLGGYQVAQKFSYTPMQDLSSIVGKVTFPVYSKFSGDRKRLKAAYFKVLASVAVVEFTVLLIVVLFAEFILKYFANSNFVYLSNTLRLLALYGFIISVWGSIGSLFFSLRKQKKLLILTAIRFVVLVPLLIALTSTLKTEGVVISLIVSILITFPLTVAFLIREFR